LAAAGNFKTAVYICLQNEDLARIFRETELHVEKSAAKVVPEL
jgi:hypothetical protein